MRFWQALVTAQMAAGSVWADRYRDVLWAHLLAEAGAIIFGLALWIVFEAVEQRYGRRPHG